MKKYEFLFRLIALVSIILVSGCKTIPIAGSEVSPDELCSKAIEGCAPEEDNYTLFERTRPSIRLDENKKEVWGDHLGRLVHYGDIRLNKISYSSLDTEPCLKLKKEDVHTVFQQRIDVDLIAESRIRADLLAELNLLLSTLKLENEAGIKTKIVSSLLRDFKENSFLKAWYKKVQISTDVLDALRESENLSPKLKKCRENIIKGDRFLIKSLAAITGQGELSTAQISSIKLSIEAALSGAKTIDGSIITAEMITMFSVSVANVAQRIVNTTTDHHSSVYGYGYWEPIFAYEAQRKKREEERKKKRYIFF